MSRSRNSARTSNVVNTEVAALFKKGDKINQTALVSLQQKYGDVALVDEIRKIFVERHAAVVRGAKRFANAVRLRYSQTNTPYSLVLEKARAHARKYRLSEAEFAEFQRIYEQELAGTSRAGEVVVPLTNMMRVLGHLDAANTGVNVSDADYRHLQEILNLYQESRMLHSRVVLQTLTHCIDKTNNDITLTGDEGFLKKNYDNHRHNTQDHIHPVVVAMFLGKNIEYESHFLHSNISGIVKARYEKEPLSTRSDYELFYDLVTDPNDIVCDHRSPLADLLHRANLQNQLWSNVLALRNGLVYNPAHKEFLTSVDVCRLNKYDNPDFLYGRNDATILKRLISAFSYRPTVVSTRPLGTPVVSSNPYFQNVNPTVTKIPMITVRVTEDNQDIVSNITGTNKQFFIEGNVVVEREVKIIYSRGNVIVYVDRRSQNIELDQFKPTTYKNLPVGVGGFQKVNNRKIQLAATQEVSFGSSDINKFTLDALVCVKTAKVNLTNNTAPFSSITSNDMIVVGSVTYVRQYAANVPQPLYIKYDPINVGPEKDSPYDKNVDLTDSPELTNDSILLFFKSKNMSDNLNATVV